MESNYDYIPEVFMSEIFGELDIIQENNKVFFRATNIAAALGYSNPRDAVRRHCKAKGITGIVERDSRNIPHRTVYIDEGNVYRLICGSKLANAEQFESWVFDEVVPTIRQTGGYVNDAKTFVANYLPNADDKTKELVLNMLEAVHHQDKVIGVQKPSVDFARAVGRSKTALSLDLFAKALQDEHVNIGRNRLFKWLRDNKYLDGKNCPYQKYIQQGWFQVQESVYYTGPYSHIHCKCLVTPKGQEKLAVLIRDSFKES